MVEMGESSPRQRRPLSLVPRTPSSTCPLLPSALWLPPRGGTAAPPSTCKPQVLFFSGLNHWAFNECDFSHQQFKSAVLFFQTQEAPAQG